MSATDNWMKLYRWWQEHLKSHSISSSSMSSRDYIISSRSISSKKLSRHIQNKNYSSSIEFDDYSINHNDFRHVRDSIRGRRQSRTIPTRKQRQEFQNSTTSDRSRTRRFSLVKFELPTVDIHQQITSRKSQQIALNSYLSKRRNTIGNISLNRFIEFKTNTSFNVNSKYSIENIFQTVEDSDFLATKQLLKSNENLLNSYNEYDWCPLDIAIMLNNIPMIRLLFHYGANESSKIQPEEVRYQSVCDQLSNSFNDLTRKSRLIKLSPDDDSQLRRWSPSCDKQQRVLTLSRMKDNYEQTGSNQMIEH